MYWWKVILYLKWKWKYHLSSPLGIYFRTNSSIKVINFWRHLLPLPSLLLLCIHRALCKGVILLLIILFSNLMSGISMPSHFSLRQPLEIFPFLNKKSTQSLLSRILNVLRQVNFSAWFLFSWCFTCFFWFPSPNKFSCPQKIFNITTGLQNSGEPYCQSPGTKIYEIKFSNSLGACPEGEKSQGVLP